ncbi:MAG: hypothetical protein ROM03_02620 [Mucispirillum sp.]|nr:hypothetical protein [Mucispirillum sp.]
MNEIIKSIYEAVADIVSPFKTLYPYQDIEADVDGGVLTFAPVKIENLTLAGEELQADGSLLVDSVARICFQVDVYKSISWNDNSISAFDMAERLQIFLKSSQARDKFYNDYKYELMPVWSDITFQADFNTYKKWVQIAQFEIFITKMSSVILTDTPLKNINIEVNEVGTLKSNTAYNSMMNKFLKTN